MLGTIGRTGGGSRREAEIGWETDATLDMSERDGDETDATLDMSGITETM